MYIYHGEMWTFCIHVCANMHILSLSFCPKPGSLGKKLEFCQKISLKCQKIVRIHPKIWSEISQNFILPSSAQALASVSAEGWGGYISSFSRQAGRPASRPSRIVLSKHNTALMPKVKLFNLTSRAHKWIMTSTLSAKRLSKPLLTKLN